MNSKLIALTFKGLLRRFKSVLRSMALIVLAFTFVTGILLLQENMKSWQIASNKKHFGDWFIIYRAQQPEENDSIKNHPYIGKNVYTAKTTASVTDATSSSAIKIGTMSDGFMNMGNIRLEKGRMPENDNETAIDRNSLIKLGQGTDVGESITINDKEYTLCGIMNSYTNVWNDGKELPGIIVMENEADNIATDMTYIYAYSLQSYIDEQDYSNIIENIRQESGLKFNLTYNSNVYDYKPLDYGRINNYIYIFIMLIGITVISYQITMYNKSRKNVRFIQKCLGADKSQIIFMTVIENAFILLISSVIGSCIAYGIGYAIQAVIKYAKGIEFFLIGQYTLIRIILTLIAAIVISFLSGVITDRRKNGNCNNRTVRIKAAINKKTFVKVTAKRLRRMDGNFQNILVRIFSLAMAAITIVCAINCIITYRKYLNKSTATDIIGAVTDSIDTPSIIHYGYQYDDYASENFYKYVSVHEIEEYKPFMDIFISGFGYENTKYGSSYIYKNVNEDIISNLKGIDGVENISYGYYENARTFTWSGMNYENIADGIQSVKPSTSSNPIKNYVFAAEYVEPDNEIYKMLNDYADGNLDYDSFKDGSQVILFLDVNNKGKYDDSVIDGVTLNLHNYETNSEYSVNRNVYKNGYAGAYDKLLNDLTESYKSNIYGNEMLNYIADNIADKDATGILDAYIENRNSKGINIYSGALKLYDAYKAGVASKKELLTRESGCLGTIVYDEWWLHQYAYYKNLAPAATSKVVKVVKLTDDIKEKFKYIVPEFGQYTIIGSTQLLQNALDSQNELTKKYLCLDELPDYVTLKMQPNQISIKYNLGSSFSATDNVVTSYLGSAGFVFTSFADEKIQLRQKTIEILMTYGITGIAAIIIYLIVSVIVLKGRMERYQTRLKILTNTGTEKEKLIKICMSECIRESWWFILLMPINLLICLVTIRKFIYKM